MVLRIWRCWNLYEEKEEKNCRAEEVEKYLKKVGGTCLDLSLAMFELLLACLNERCCGCHRRAEGRWDLPLDR